MMQKEITTYELHCDFCGNKVAEFATPYGVPLVSGVSVRISVAAYDSESQAMDICQQCADSAIVQLAGRLPND